MYRSAWLLLLVGAGCQHDITTPFPPGLEPLEDNPVELPDGAPAEQLTTESNDVGHISIWAKGFIFEPPATVWEASKNPDAMAATCSTDSHTVDVQNESPEYEFSFLLHYHVSEVVSVDWDDQWRQGSIQGSGADLELGMIKHQKVMGSSFINLSEGTIQVLATDDDHLTEVDFVEHLDAIGGGVGDVLSGVQHTYASMVAVSHGRPVPPCP